MAWIDDRIWCHPKILPISDKAFRVYVHSVAYSAGMDLSGKLDPSHQKVVGATRRIRGELVAARLWDENGDGATVVIHDWDEHNGKRDERRRKDRERKRELRRSKYGKSA